MKALFTLLFLTISISCLAQKQYVYLFNNDGKLVNTQDSTDFIRELVETAPGSNEYNVTEFYKSGKRKLAGKSLAIYPLKFDGTVISFFENGRRSAVNNYKQGELVNEQYEYFPNGKLYNVKKYDDLKITQAGPFTLISDQKPHLIFTNLDSLGSASVTEGNGYYKGYDSQFTYVFEEGPIKNGLRDGEWKGREDTIFFVETYKKGLLVEGLSTFKSGHKQVYKVDRATPPEFSGGTMKFLRFLADNIRYPAYDRERNIQGRVVLTFDINIDGGIENINVVRAPTINMAQETVRVLSLSPKWIPAKKFGLNISFKSYAVPVNYTLNDER